MLGSCKKASNVLRVLKNDDQGDEDIASDDHRRAIRRVRQREDWKERRTHNGCQRDVSRQKDDDQKNPQNVQDGSERYQGQEDSESSSYPFASMESKPDREAMTEYGGQGSSGWDIVRLRKAIALRNVLCEDDGEKSLERIQDESEDAQTLGSGSGHVGGTDIAAPGRTYILVPEDPDKKIAERNRSEQVSKRNGKNPGDHSRTVQVYQLSLNGLGS